MSKNTAKSQGRKRSKGKEKKIGWLDRKWGWLLIGLGVVAALAVMFMPDAATDHGVDYHDPVVIDAGGGLFAEHCATCHGEQAVGQEADSPMGGTRADGTYIAPALNGNAHSWHHPPEMMFRIIRDGSPAQGSPMVAFAGRMNDGEIHWVMAYVQSLWPEEIRGSYRRQHGQ